MKALNSTRIEELMKLKEEFNDKLKEAFERYETRIKEYQSKKNQHQKIPKSKTENGFSINNESISNQIKKRKKLPKLIPKVTEDLSEIKYKLPRRNRSHFKDIKIWRPPYMVNDYFDMFRRLQDKYEMSVWEKVNHLFYN